MSGDTTFRGGDAFRYEGLRLLDYDDVVDRNESLHLLEAIHSLNVFINSTETADGTVQISAAVSASPAGENAAIETDPTTSSFDDSDVVGSADFDDTIDVLGRGMVATAHAPFSDSATGVGGGGSAGEDRYSSRVFPEEYGAFHPRDELFVNGVIRGWNVDDSGVHGQVNIQHVYGVVDE